MSDELERVKRIGRETDELVRQLRTAAESVENHWGEGVFVAAAFPTIVQRAADRIESLTRDAERLDWLDSKRRQLGAIMGAPACAAWSFFGNFDDSVRDAIDRALKHGDAK